MVVAELLDELRRRNVQLDAHGDRLRFRPQQMVGPELREALTRHKSELLELIAERQGEAGWRVDAMRPQVPLRGAIPLLVARSGITPGPGDCVSCGEPLPAKREWRCTACVQAAWLVIHAVREGVAIPPECGGFP